MNSFPLLVCVDEGLPPECARRSPFEAGCRLKRKRPRAARAGRGERQCFFQRPFFRIAKLVAGIVWRRAVRSEAVEEVAVAIGIAQRK